MRKKNPRFLGEGFLYLAHPERLELPTKWFEATYSIQLSYGCMVVSAGLKEAHMIAGGGI